MTTPRISVRTTGPRKWAVSVRRRATADDVRQTLRRRGLACGQIRKRGQEYVFTADGGNLEDDRSSQQS